MVLDTRAHVNIGTSVIDMKLQAYEDNIDHMSEYKLREWKGAFGARPIVCFEAWAMIYRDAARKKLQVQHFYWALYWMRTYQIETEAARTCKTDPKTFRKKVRKMIEILAAKMTKVVSECVIH